MASSHGKSGVFKYDNSGGSLQDISTNITKVDLNFDVELSDDSSLGDSSRSVLAGLKSYTISLEGWWSPTANEVDAIFGGTMGQSSTQTFQYFPVGTASGSVVYYGESRPESYIIGIPVDDTVSFSATIKTSGNVTRSTVA